MAYRSPWCYKTYEYMTKKRLYKYRQHIFLNIFFISQVEIYLFFSDPWVVPDKLQTLSCTSWGSPSSRFLWPLHCGCITVLCCPAVPWLFAGSSRSRFWWCPFPPERPTKQIRFQIVQILQQKCYTIGDLWVAFRLCFKASPSAKPFIWKLVLFTRKWTKICM